MLTITASKKMTVERPGVINVQIIDEAFFIPQLNRYRRIWLYLPPGYENSGLNYPVIYMQDGQNLFDNATAFGEEWHIDEMMTTMAHQSLVVGIDNGGEHRLTEYNFYDHAEYGTAEGRDYLSFIVDTLKPFIDTHYRTLNNREHTFIAGSSMGGLISFYAALYFPDVFGGAGILSPSFWLNKHLKDEVAAAITSHSYSQKYYFYCGDQEADTMLERVNEVISVLKEHPGFSINQVIDPKGCHSENCWAVQFPLFYQWMVNSRFVLQKCG
jgi:predicted alpha/beta superfamily hydrolase